MEQKFRVAGEAKNNPAETGNSHSVFKSYQQ
jgi:hypothetical protein